MDPSRRDQAAFAGVGGKPTLISLLKSRPASNSTAHSRLRIEIIPAALCFKWKTPIEVTVTVELDDNPFAKHKNHR